MPSGQIRDNRQFRAKGRRYANMIALRRIGRLARTISSTPRTSSSRRESSSCAATTTLLERKSITPYDPSPGLVELRGVKLAYPEASSSSSSSSSPQNNNATPPMDLIIEPPSTGGHVLLGRNGCGKTLIGQSIAAGGHSDFLKEGSFTTDGNNNNGRFWHSRAVAHVSFASHQELSKKGGSAYKAISGGGGVLTKAAQFLVVRFGLYSLLTRDVSTLSTGEIRKVLLVKALSHRPRLLILDNAFDGLDVASREVLKDVVGKTLAGFKQDILVQGVNAKTTAHTQVLLVTHRAEEIVDGIKTISYFDYKKGRNKLLRTERRDGRSGFELLRSALLEVDADAETTTTEDSNTTTESIDINWDDPVLPSLARVTEWWRTNRGATSSSESSTDGTVVVVNAKNLSIRKGDVTLLRDLNWTIRTGERWLVAGGNGAGKSTLSRLLAKSSDLSVDNDDGHLDVLPHLAQNDEEQRQHHHRVGVGWVSTEKHIRMARSEQLTRDVLLSSCDNDESVAFDTARVVAAWLGVGDDDDDELFRKPFRHLSQGQQKLILIAAALAKRPPLLVLDEPCQGLDLLNRQRLLGVVERVCKATDMSLVYITHHFEELLPSVTHVLHLDERRDVYNGTVDGYDPEDYSMQSS